MKNKLRVLIVEDSEDDAELLLRELKSGGYEPLSERVDMPEALSDALKRQSWDVITCDHSMPHFDAFKVLVLLRSSGIDVPCIIVSGKIGEETAVKLMKAGANDYIMKGNLNRLAPAIEREILDKEVRHARKLAESELLIKNRAIQSSINATALSDLEGNLTDVNPSFLKMWRCNNDKEVLGKSVVEFCSEKEKASKVIVALQNHGSWTGELSSKRKDGSTFFVQLSANLVTSYDGKPVCMMASFIDITDRIKAESLLIESEEKYRSIIETSNEGILIANTENYKFKYANPAICRMLGYTQKELTAMDVTAIHPKENLQSILGACPRIANN